MSETQFGRKASLILVEGEKAIDLSEFHFTFETTQQDVESPNTAAIRIYNLKPETVKQVRGEFSRVVLQAGYQENFGVIFDGTIRQFRIGRQNATDSYLDILAADGDLAYNWAVVSKTIAGGTTNTPEARVKAAIDAMSGGKVGSGYIMPFSGGILPRGKVLFGMARSILRNEVGSQGATWNIDSGKVSVIPKAGYLPGEAVKLTSASGLIGVPEQTVDGLRVTMLLNPRIKIAGLVQIDNRLINQTINRDPTVVGPAYNQYAGVQLLANVTSDGIYRVYVAEHKGDTRGKEWYTNLVCLAVAGDTKQVKVQ